MRFTVSVPMLVVFHWSPGVVVFWFPAVSLAVVVVQL